LLLLLPLARPFAGSDRRAQELAAGPRSRRLRACGSRLARATRRRADRRLSQIIVSDRRPGYDHLDPCSRRVCWSHLQRDCRAHAGSKLSSRHPVRAAATDRASCAQEPTNPPPPTVRQQPARGMARALDLRHHRGCRTDSDSPTEPFAAVRVIEPATRSCRRGGAARSKRPAPSKGKYDEADPVDELVARGHVRLTAVEAVFAASPRSGGSGWRPAAWVL